MSLKNINVFSLNFTFNSGMCCVQFCPVWTLYSEVISQAAAWISTKCCILQYCYNISLQMICLEDRMFWPHRQHRENIRLNISLVNPFLFIARFEQHPEAALEVAEERAEMPYYRSNHIYIRCDSARSHFSSCGVFAPLCLSALGTSCEKQTTRNNNLNIQFAQLDHPLMHPLLSFSSWQHAHCK